MELSHRFSQNESRSGENAIQNGLERGYVTGGFALSGVSPAPLPTWLARVELSLGVS